MHITEFWELYEHESWQGLATVFKSGSKSAITGDECNYIRRQDFQAAWERGRKEMQN